MNVIIKKLYNQYRQYHFLFSVRSGYGVPFSPEYWETTYKSGNWQHCGDLKELGRFSIVAGYLQYFKSGGTFLEVGCCDGLLVQRLNSDIYTRYVGIDISQEAIEKAASNANEKCSFLWSNAEEFVTDDRFDAIIIMESLCYFQDPVKLLKHYEQFLANDGIFVLSLYRPGKNPFRRPLRIWKRISYHYRLLDYTILKTIHNHIYDIRVFYK